MTYDRSIDCPHTPDENPLWQESDCYWFYDEKTGIGGFNRLGQRPSQETGQLQLFLFKKGGKRFSLQNEEVRGADCARWETGQRVGTATAESLEDMKVRWTWNEPDCSGDLEFYEAFYEPRDWKKTEDVDFSSKINDGGHLECSGRVKGTVRIGAEEYVIDGFAHRDRSWGARDHNVVRQHRMYTGTVGPSLSWATAIMQFRGGQTVNLGFVVVDGVDYDIENLECLAEVAFDTYTLKRGTLKLTYDGGKDLEIDAKPVQGFVTNMFGMTSTDHIAVVEHGGQRGFCDLEASFLVAGQTETPLPQEVFLACNELGLSDTSNYES